MGKALNLVGQKFGKLSVISKSANREGSGVVRWVCKCACGSPEKDIRGYLLTTAATKSCGCLASERTSERNKKHGHCGTPEYAAWQGMWDRCTNPNNPAYAAYKFRRPPEQWRSFEVFYAELGPRPSSHHSLDRKDNSKPYGPGNCRWATDKEQSRNRKTNIKVVFQNTVMTLREACVACGFKYTTVRARYINYGWDMKSASNGMFDIK